MLVCSAQYTKVNQYTLHNINVYKSYKRDNSYEDDNSSGIGTDVVQKSVLINRLFFN